MPIVRAALLVGIAVLAGCLQAGPSSSDRAGVDANGLSTLPVLNVSFAVKSRAGGDVVIAGDLWPVDGATTALVLLHGHSGVKENYWNTLPQKGVGFAAREAARGRSVVAIDLPGYGESKVAAKEGTGIEDFAFVVDQVAKALRSGAYAVKGGSPAKYAKVAAYGLSMGGLVTDVTQGTFGSFDAIVVTGWAHVKPSDRGLECQRSGKGCPTQRGEDDFNFTNTDPEVVNATLAGYQKAPFVQAEQAGYPYSFWMGPSTLQYVTPAGDAARGAPRPDDVTRTITVPVLVMAGEGDLGIDPEALVKDEVSHFPRAASFEARTWPGANHFLHNHKLQPELAAYVDAWLTKARV